jgi:membrane peptidoglycan carboxypeptidase
MGSTARSPEWPDATRRRWIPIIASTLALAAAATGAAAWVSAPNPSDLSARVRDAAAANGANLVALSDVAPVMREAIVATEDERFYRHHGIDLIGVARALAYDISHFTTSQGASTISEQLAKVLYLGCNDHSIWRKLEAAVIA